MAEVTQKQFEKLYDAIIGIEKVLAQDEIKEANFNEKLDDFKTEMVKVKSVAYKNQTKITVITTVATVLWTVIQGIKVYLS